MALQKASLRGHETPPQMAARPSLSLVSPPPAGAHIPRLQGAGDRERGEFAPKSGMT